MLKNNQVIQGLKLFADCFTVLGGMESICEGLIENHSLTTLDIECSNVGDEGATAVACMLKENKTLLYLSFSNYIYIYIIEGSNFGGQGLQDICIALEGNNTLQKILLSTYKYRYIYYNSIL